MQFFIYIHVYCGKFNLINLLNLMKPFVYFALKDKSDVILSNILLLFIYSKLTLFKVPLIKEISYNSTKENKKMSCCLQNVSALWA